MNKTFLEENHRGGHMGKVYVSAYFCYGLSKEKAGDDNDEVFPRNCVF